MNSFSLSMGLLLVVFFSGCASKKDLSQVNNIDLPRFDYTKSEIGQLCKAEIDAYKATVDALIKLPKSEIRFQQS